MAPAIGSFDPNTGFLLLEYTSATMEAENVTLTNDGITITASGNISGTTNFATSTVKAIRAWSSANGGAQTLTLSGTTAYSLPSGVQLVSGLDVLTVNTAISTETSDFSVTTWKGVSITAPVTTTTGNISINANIYTLKGPGNYSGVNISSNVTTEGGNLSIVGVGGSDSSGLQCGILIGNSAKVFAGGNGSVSLTGTGGANAGTNNRGVYITGNSIVGTARGGSITVNGTGGDLAGLGNIGVLINSGSRITPLGSGNISITGKGGSSSGTINAGVRVADSNTAIRVNDGSISINGTGGSGSTESGKQASDYNVIVESGAIVSIGPVGSGNIVADSYNSNNDVLAIDLAKPLSLAAGTYKASTFNREIVSLSSGESSGSITPALVVAQGGGYVPVAVGASATYSGAAGFSATTFGGSDTFTLSQATTVYAAIHWRAPHYVGGPYRMPVGYANNSGSSLVFYAEGYGTGGALPYVGLACAGTSQATFSRSYDFSVTVENAPPPSGGSSPASGNLIANGDFSLGNTAFGSQYVLTPGNIGSAQTYDVATSWNVLTYGDHTTGAGKMLGVNGSNVANVIFWHQKVAVLPNTDYTFSFWTSSWFPGATPLAILVDGTAIGTGSVPAGIAQWQQITVAWNSGNRTFASFSLAATQGFDIGGDFAIDDISLVKTNRPPVFSSLSNQSDITGNQVSFSIASAFSDPDSDTLTFTATNLPPGLSISSSGTITGTILATATTTSPYSVTISANDGRGGTISGSFSWSVSSATSDSSTTVGVGDLQNPSGGGSYNLLYIDLLKSADLAPGVYKATTFGREFTNFATITTGDVIPLVLIKVNENYVPVAIGNTNTYRGPFGFSDIQFGNNDSFTLYSPTAVYGGVYWAAPFDRKDNRCPIGYVISEANSSFLYQGNGSGSDANRGPDFPQLNKSITSINGGGLSSFKWEFNIGISRISAPPNREPILSSLGNRNDSAGNPVSFSIAPAFSDPDSDSLSFSATGLPTGLTISSAGLISGTITSTATTSSPFTTRITASDGRGGSVTGSFTWTVTGPNRNPVVGTLANQTSAISDTVNLSIASAFSDPDNDSLTFTATNLPPGLTISSSGAITGTILTSASTSSPYTVTVSVSDGRGGTATGTFPWAINSVFRIGPGNITGGAFDGANDLLAVDLNRPIQLPAGSYTAGNFYRQISIYTVSQTTGSITPILLVASGNGYKPVAVGASIPFSAESNYSAVPFGGESAFTLTGNSTVYGGLYWSAPQDHLLEYRMPIGYSGSGSSFVYYGGGTGAGAAKPAVGVQVSSTAQGIFGRSYDFAIDVYSADPSSNRPPVFSSLTNRSNTSGTQVSFSAAGAFSDPDSDTLSFTATGLPTGLSISSAGLISGMIASTATASSPFTTRITASDGRGGSVTGSFTWTVTAPNRNPVAGTLPNRSSGISSVVNLSVASSFSDPDNDALTFSATNLPPGLTISANGTVTGTILSSASITTPYSVTVSANDGRGGTATGSFSWTIRTANRLPVVSPLNERTDNTGTSISFAVAQAFSDPDSDTLTFTATGLPDGLSISPTGTISGTIAAQASNSSPFTTRITADDGRGGSVTGSFIWNISAGLSIPHNTAFDLIGLTDLRANPATAGIDGSGIGVAVIDTGIDYAHALFQSGNNPAYYATTNAGGGQVPVGRNFAGDAAPGNFVPGDRRNRFSSSRFNSTEVNQRNADYVASGDRFDFSPVDTNGHGTHVAGIIGARNPEIGVATGSKLIGLKVLGADGTGSNENILKALAWVRDNASLYNIKVVNMSLGYGFFQYRGPDDPFLATISDLESMGITVVSAAGNLYGLTPTERNSSTPGIASTLTVGAVWKDGAVNQAYWPEGDTYDYTTGPGFLASFSQRPADTVDNGIFAPGALMLSAIPNNGLDPARGDDLTAELAGTSQAAPVVSGVVALMQDAAFRSGGRYLSPSEIREILFQTATTINDGDNEDDGFARDPLTLRYELDNNTHADYRMINANRAVAMVRSMFDTPSADDDPNGVITSAVELSPDYSRIQIADIDPDLNVGDPNRYIPVVADFQGEIGADGEATVGDNDVDLYAFTVNMPGVLNIRTTRASYSAPIVNTQLRLFDSNGNEITADVENRDDNDPSTDSNGLFDPFSTLKARLEPGRYFIGVSGQGNAFYSPMTELSGTAGTAVLGVEAKGPYHLTMDYVTQDPNGLLAGAKETFLQVTGAAVQRGFLGGDYLSCSADIAFPSPDQLDPAYGGTVVDAGALGADGKLSHTISTKVTDVDLFIMTAPENGYISFDIDSLDYTNLNDAGMAADTYVRAWRVEEDGTLTELGSNDNGYNPDERLVDADGRQANDSRQSTGLDAFLKVPVNAGDRILFGVSDHNNQGYSPLDLANRSAVANSHVGFYDAFATFSSNDINGRIGSDVYNLDTVGSKGAVGTLPTTLGSFSIGYDDQSTIGGPAKADIGPKDIDFYAYTASASGTLFVDVDSLETSLPDRVATVLTVFEIVIDANGFRTLNVVGTSADGSGIPTGVDPRLGVQVTAGRQYYVAVSGAGNTSFNPFRQASGTAGTGTGTYKLQSSFAAQNTVVSDAPITVFRPANRTRFSSARLGYDASGAKVSGNDLDTFIYTPAGNGAVSISVLPGAESAASPSFRIFSQTGSNPYVPVNQTVGRPGTVTINVTAGTKYAVVASGSRSAITTNGVSFQSTGPTRGTTGAYTVSIDDTKLTTAPPVLNGPASRSFTISSNSTLTGFSIADPDAGSTVSTITASVDRGTLTGGGKSGASVTITGTLTQLNASLSQLAFKSANFDATPAKLTLAAKDSSGNSATLTSTLTPTQNLITTITDPQLAGKKSVLVVGTSSADVMSVTGSGTTYRVVMNGRTVNLTGVNGRILAFGLAGNDSIDMPSVSIATVSYGGDGNDIIRAGSAADLLFGEAGADLLAGGLGADQINGGADNDLLFDGSVTPKSASVSLASTLALWKSLANPTDANYTTIYNRLTITSDKNSRDNIQGSVGLDLFFASASDILDKIASERTRFA